MLKGQVAVSALDAGGTAQGATGLHIEGVLDDLYTYDGPLGVAWTTDADDPRLGADGQERDLPPLRGQRSGHHQHDHADDLRPRDLGVWSITGQPGWQWQYYLFEVEVRTRPSVSSTTWSLTRTA